MEQQQQKKMEQQRLQLEQEQLRLEQEQLRLEQERLQQHRQRLQQHRQRLRQLKKRRRQQQQLLLQQLQQYWLHKLQQREQEDLQPLLRQQQQLPQLAAAAAASPATGAILAILGAVSVDVIEANEHTAAVKQLRLQQQQELRQLQQQEWELQQQLQFFGQQQPHQQLLHFCDSKHPLVFIPNYRGGATCCGCQESIYGPSYWCPREGCPGYFHHKSCAELPLGLHHPLHPIHPLILSPEQVDYGKDIKFSNCLLCKEYKDEYTYRCSCCDFNLHITCAAVPQIMEVEFHDHPLIPIWKLFTFTCDICGKEGKGSPYMCQQCSFWVHGRCAHQFPHIVKVVRHRHLLHLTHSSLEFHQSDSRLCQICVRKVDTHYGFYYCSKCDFAAHLDCTMENKENISLQEFKDEDEVSKLNESVESTIYEVKKCNRREDGTTIATEIKHFSHEHDLKLTNKVLNNQKCDGCVSAIVPPFYRCVKCNFFLHELCANLPKQKRHPLHQHPLTLRPMKPSMDFWCHACHRFCNGFTYQCKICWFSLDVQCSMIPENFKHPGHEHQLLLSSIPFEQNCSCCASSIYPIFRCTTCDFALDFRCATMPHSTRYKQHEHPFALSYKAEDDSDEYYCDICEEERRDSKYWFYYCKDCNYPAHPDCIIGKYPNYKFGGAYKFEHHHSHPLTFIEETKDCPRCNECNGSCEELIYRCAQCNVYIHKDCL